MKSSRISRVVRILTALQAGKKYRADDLAKIFGTSRRTVFRDLNELQAIGVPYRYDAKSGSYTIDPEFFLPPIDLDLREALSLLMLVHKASDHLQMPFKNSTLLAALKIENNLPIKVRQYCHANLKYISTRPHAKATVDLLNKTFDQLQRAITTKHRVKMQYNSLFERKIIETELWPYHLLYNRRAWYVLGMSSLHKSIRTFKINRIKHLKTLDKCFLGGEHFDLHDYLGSAWSMIPEGRIYNVKLRLLPKVAENVCEVQWHKSQKVTRNRDGSAIAQFRVDGLGEISWWILGYGDQVQILAPKTLRNRIIKTAKNMIKLNEKT